MERRKITTVILSEDRFHGSPSELDDLLSSLVAAVPPEFVKNIVVEFGDGSHGLAEEPRPEFSVSWWRLETDEEVKKRVERDEANRQAMIAQQELRERELLVALKRKYE